MKGARQWKHGGPIPVRYRPLLQELRAEIASKPGLERRARRVKHDLDALALGRWAVGQVNMMGIILDGGDKSRLSSWRLDTPADTLGTRIHSNSVITE